MVSAHNPWANLFERNANRAIQSAWEYFISATYNFHRIHYVAITANFCYTHIIIPGGIPPLSTKGDKPWIINYLKF